jgi:phospholipase A-2-activating protein
VYSLITQWPYGDRLPALDALRCFVALPGSATLNDTKFGSVVDVALKGALDTEDPVYPSDEPLAEFIKKFDASKPSANNLMMALRTVTNLFATAEGRAVVAAEAPAVISLLARIAGVEGDPIGVDNNNLQIALTSAAFNFACLAFNQKQQQQPTAAAAAAIDLEQLMLLCQVAEAVVRRQSEPEVLFRALMTLGMVLVTGAEARELARTLELGDPVGEAAKKAGEARIKAVAQECLALLRG